MKDVIQVLCKLSGKLFGLDANAALFFPSQGLVDFIERRCFDLEDRCAKEFVQAVYIPALDQCMVLG